MEFCIIVKSGLKVGAFSETIFGLRQLSDPVEFKYGQENDLWFLEFCVGNPQKRKKSKNELFASIKREKLKRILRS